MLWLVAIVLLLAVNVVESHALNKSKWSAPPTAETVGKCEDALNLLKFHIETIFNTTYHLREQYLELTLQKSNELGWAGVGTILHSSLAKGVILKHEEVKSQNEAKDKQKQEL